MKTGALILAMVQPCSPFSLKSQKDALTCIQRAAGIFLSAGIEHIVLVINTSAEALKRQTARMGIIYLECKSPKMSDGMQTGLAYLQGQCDQAFILPITTVFSVSIIEALIKHSGHMALPTFKGVPGYPVLLPKSEFEWILFFNGDDDLIRALTRTGGQWRYIEVDDKGILPGLSSSNHNNEYLQGKIKKMRPVCKLRLIGSDIFFGPGTAWLLTQIDFAGSVRVACEQLGMSYSKGWKMIKKIEEELGYAVVERKRGGKSGGETSLSQGGRAFLAQYTQYEQACKEAIGLLFEKYFPDNQ